MRINFILPTVDMSGGIKVVTIYAQALVAKGHQVVIISPPPREPSLRQKIKSLIRRGRWPSRSPHPSPLDGLALDHRILDQWRAPTDADVPDGDVIVATWWETAEWVNALSDAKGAKVYFIQHHEVFDHLPIERCKATYKLPIQKIVIARWLVDVMRDRYGDSDVDLVYNAVDRNQFYAELRGKQNVPTVGFLFHRAAFKGVDIAIRAIEQLRLGFPNLRVISFGAEMPDDDLITNAKIEFHYLPPQERLRELYALCDVWLTASRSEGFNLPAMEAMACRTPVVSTRTGWPLESIQNGKNGLLVDIDDVDALAKGTSSILSLSNEAWQDFSNAAFKSVADSSWAESTKKFEQALERARKHPATIVADNWTSNNG